MLKSRYREVNVVKRNQNGWVSEYRRKKFLESRKKPIHNIQYLDLEPLKIPSKIVVMLDLDGTLDGIDEEKAKTFLRQLDYIRKKFQADEGLISISTHYDNVDKIVKVLDIINKRLVPNIKIGMSFYYGGIYDYEKKLSIPRGDRFNQDKVKTFTSYYLDVIGISTKWFALIDDGVDKEIYLRYQNSYPMLLGIPSQNSSDSVQNNFMRYVTPTFGFDGVLEIMDQYTDAVRNLSSTQILEKQRDMITHLSSYELVDKIRRRNYTFLERYFKEGYADENDYSDTLSWLLLTNSETPPSLEELKILSRIFTFMISHFEVMDDKNNVEKIYQIQKRFNTKEN